MSDESTGGEQTLDQQLEAILSSDAPASASGKGTTPKPDTKPPVATSPPAADQTPAGEADPLEEALKAIEDEKPEEKQVPAISDEQQQILRAIPDAATAANLYGVVQNYSNFTNAFESGEYAKVQGMFEAWNPAAFDGFLEHIYAEKVASGEWVDRFIAEQEGTGKQHQGMKTLERKIQNLESQLNQRTQGTQQAQKQTQEQQSFAAYNTHVNALFDQIKFSAADRRWVANDLNARIVSDPKVLAAIKNGNVAAVNSVFKTAVREYVNRDKQVSEENGVKIADQSRKKMPLGGGAGAQEAGELPDDIRQVKKGQEDSWLDQQLGKLAKIAKRK